MADQDPSLTETMPPAEIASDSEASEISEEESYPNEADGGEGEEPHLAAAWAQAAIEGMDAARVADLYVARMAALDDPAPQPAAPMSTKRKVVRTSSRPKLATATSGNVGSKSSRRATPTSVTAGGGEIRPHATFEGMVRCAARVGTTIWTAHKDGCIVIHDAQTGKQLERILSGQGAGWEQILAIAPCNGTVWCGSESGPVLLFDKVTRRIIYEARQHTGCVHCIAAAPTAGGRGYVVSGGADRRLNMWHLDGKLMKTLSGHSGGVRCVLILGMEIWTGSDDGTVRIWDAAHGVFQLETDPVRAVLSGHTGAVHALASHSEGVLSCSADGTVRVWKAASGGGGSQFDCLREVALRSGPIYQLVPMGKHVWAAGADGRIHTLDGATLDEACPPRQAHSNFVTGLCALQARTTRQLWSFSTEPGGRVCRWRVDEPDAQLTSERAAMLACERDSLAAQLEGEHGARREEQLAAAERAARDAETIEEAQAQQRQLVEELASAMETSERDLMEAERLRDLLRTRDEEHARREREHARRHGEAERRVCELEDRAAAAEADATAAAAAAEEMRVRAVEVEAREGRRQALAERMAMRAIRATLGGLGGVQELRARRERRLHRRVAAEEEAAAAAAAAAADAAAEAADATAEAAGQGHQLEVAQAADDTAEAPGEEPSGSMTRAGFWDGEGASLVSTATSLDDLLATSGDIPTVARWENQSAEATASPPL